MGRYVEMWEIWGDLGGIGEIGEDMGLDLGLEDEVRLPECELGDLGLLLLGVLLLGRLPPRTAKGG